MISIPQRTVVLFLLIAAPLVIAAAGCGSAGAPESHVASSEGSVEKGVAAYAAGDWATAEKECAAAIAAGALQPDQTEAAMRTLTRARIQLGQIEQAEKDLAQLEQGAAELDLVWLTKAELAIKKGDKAAAQSAFAEAKMLNKKVSTPTGL